MANIRFNNNNGNDVTFVDFPIRGRVATSNEYLDNTDYTLLPNSFVTWADKIDWGGFQLTINGESRTVSNTYKSFVDALQWMCSKINGSVEPTRILTSIEWASATASSQQGNAPSYPNIKLNYNDGTSTTISATTSGVTLSTTINASTSAGTYNITATYQGKTTTNTLSYTVTSQFILSSIEWVSTTASSQQGNPPSYPNIRLNYNNGTTNVISATTSGVTLSRTITSSTSVGTYNITATYQGKDTTNTLSYTVTNNSVSTYYWYAGQTVPTSMSSNPTVDDTNFTNNKWHTLGSATQIRQTVTGGTAGNSWYVAVPTSKGFSAYASDMATPNNTWNKLSTITVNSISYDVWKPNSTGAKMNIYMK